MEHLRDTSRPYQNQAMALIGICRFFSQFLAQGQGRSQDTESSQDAELTRVLRSCDHVLRFVAHSGHRSKHQTDDRFRSAIDTLSSYASTFHPGIDVVRARMGVARGRDTVLHAALRPEQPDLMVVNFVLFRTLPDPKPIVVSQILSQTASFEEVLWNFAHFEDERRITLQDNPHFYSELPTSLDAYTPQFKASPVDKSELKPNATIYVLVDQRRRMFLETRRETRTFGNVFTLKNAMIFKDIHGALEGESVVAQSIRGIPNLWHSEKFFVVPDSSTSAYDFSLFPIVTANTTAKRTSQDRIDLIRNALGSGDKDLHIYAGQLPPLWTTRKIATPPSPPTSERPEYVPLYTSVDALNSKILLTIFDHYRLDDEESWNLQLRWCKLSRVCPQWRNVIHRSACRLDMHIPFTSCTCPFDIPTHLPPLPIVIDSRGSDVTGTDADIFHAIQQYDHIRHVALKACTPTMDKLIVPMNEPFPILDSSSHSSTTVSETSTELTIPTTFLPPILHHITSHGAYLPTEPPILTSSVSLFTLKLTDIQPAEYFTPGDLVTQLQHIRQLEELSIGFSIPLPRPGDEGGLLREPSTLTVLPSLKQLEFRGVGAYLESLLSRIDTPLLERFNVTLFTQLTFKLPRLFHFTRTTEGLRYPVASVVFNRDGVSFIAGAHRFGDGPFSLQVRCKQLEWQIAAATQICNALEPVLSVVEDVNLEFDSRPPAWRDAVDGTAWGELLRPFNRAKSLRIDCQPASERCGVPGSYEAGLTPWQHLSPRHLAPPVETEHANASSTLIDSPPLSPARSVLPIPVPVHHPQHAHSTGSFVMVEIEKEVIAEQEVPLVSDPPPAKKNWFRRAVVDRVRKRMGSHACAGGRPVF